MLDQAGFFKCLGDETRLNIVKTLVKSEESVLSIVKKVNKSQPNVSINLRILRYYNIVKSRKDGSTVYYSIKDKKMIKKLLQIVVEK